MEYQGDLTGGSSAFTRRYQVAATQDTVGVPLLVPASSGSGLVAATTTGTAKAVGVTLDASGTYVTAQQTASADTRRTCLMSLSPFAIYSLLMSGAAAEGTAMVLYTADGAGGTDGLTIAFTVSVASPQMDEGTCFCLSGANVGVSRKITSTSTVTATFTVAWPRDVLSGDTFLIAPYNPLQGITLQLTTLLTQADTSIAVGTGAAFKTTELKFLDAAHEGRSNSYVNAILANHVLASVLADS